MTQLNGKKKKKASSDNINPVVFKIYMGLLLHGWHSGQRLENICLSIEQTHTQDDWEEKSKLYSISFSDCIQVFHNFRVHGIH